MVLYFIHPHSNIHANNNIHNMGKRKQSRGRKFGLSESCFYWLGDDWETTCTLSLMFLNYAWLCYKYIGTYHAFVRN